MIRRLSELYKERRFLFEELVKRDFKKKYKRTVLGMGWSVLSPLMTLTVMSVVFGTLFGRSINHFTTYLFCGILVFGWFSESSGAGMRSLMENAGIFTRVNIPKYLFLFSKNIQTLLNFLITFAVFIMFCFLDHIEFTWKFSLIVYPMFTLLVFNIGIGFVLSALFVFFRDMDYLWAVFLQLLMYGSAIFYDIGDFPPGLRRMFLFNPIYRHVAYFREVVIAGSVPSVESHLVLLGSAVAALAVGCSVYRHYNTKFLYYV